MVSTFVCLQTKQIFGYPQNLSGPFEWETVRLLCLSTRPVHESGRSSGGRFSLSLFTLPPISLLTSRSGNSSFQWTPATLINFLKGKSSEPRVATQADEAANRPHFLTQPVDTLYAFFLGGSPFIWVWLKIKQEGQAAGFGSCFHLPGFHLCTGFLSHSHSGGPKSVHVS